MENDTIYNDEELSSLLEFAFERDYKTEEERQELNRTDYYISW